MKYLISIITKSHKTELTWPFVSSNKQHKGRKNLKTDIDLSPPERETVSEKTIFSYLSKTEDSFPQIKQPVFTG